MNPFAFYGHKIIIPSDTHTNHYINQLYNLNSIINSPFKICNILPSFSNQLDNDDIFAKLNSILIIGFVIDSNLDNNIILRNELDTYLIDNPIFEGIDIQSSATLHCGIEWITEYESDSENESSDNHSESSDDISESDEEL